ncbi:MAG: class I SAM-dependent methyltransferase [Elusimicrobia bacterium]|nr:class I SAM-dependent methyltransferase [Elusimicrobiota bacterium]
MKKHVNRLYSDLAWLWPMWGNPKEEYKQWCDLVVKITKRYAKRRVRSLLNMGCGGGKNAFNLKKHFNVTGIDISKPMLKLAKRLNPECTFRYRDMRNCSLKRQFDSVLIDDSVSYLLTETDLLRTFRTAYKHLADGGIMIVSPDNCKETFRQNTARTSTAAPASKPDNTDVVFIENYYDPDKRDTTYEGTLIYLIRKNGKLRVEQDMHILGLFSLNVWRKKLCESGFKISAEIYEDRWENIPTFVCTKPL